MDELSFHMSISENKQGPVELKLSAARTRLIIDKPFLGALVLRLPMVAADPQWCRTTATDARQFFYNPEYIEQLTAEETQFVLAHEALHCALSHFARREHRIKMRWDLACDYAINPLLIKDGLKPPPNTLYEKSYDGMTAEEIYPFIDEHDNNEPMDHHIYDDESKDGHNEQGKSETPPPDLPEQDNAESSGNSEQTQKGKSSGQGVHSSDGHKQQSIPSSGFGSNSGSEQGKSKTESDRSGKQRSPTEQQGAAQPPPLTLNERETLSVQWKQRMAGAAQQALQAGKLDGDMARLVDFLLQPELPWRNLLSHYMTMTARDDYSYTRPSSRRGGPSIYPSLRSAQINIIVAVDTSGSITESEINEFISEIDAIKSLIRARITLLACDAELAAGCPWVYEPWDEFSLPKQISGGGGTSFVPVYNWVDSQDQLPDLLVYFTDADGRFPDTVPNYPVIWLVKGKTPVPFGQRVQLN